MCHVFTGLASWKAGNILEYCINFIDKIASRLERIDSNFKRSSTVDKILSNSIAYYREIVHERKSIDAASFIIVWVLRNCQSPQPIVTTIWAVSHHQHQGIPSTSKKNYNSLKSRWWVIFFTNEVFCCSCFWKINFKKCFKRARNIWQLLWSLPSLGPYTWDICYRKLAKTHWLSSPRKHSINLGALKNNEPQMENEMATHSNILVWKIPFAWTTNDIL